MKKLTKKELNLILEKHKKWLNDEEGGERANLCRIDLSGINFTNANLKHVDFRRANLTNTNFRYANLSFVDFYSTTLKNAKLCGAIIYAANFSRANLEKADLRQTTNIEWACFRETDLTNAILPDFQIPQDKVIIGYKKCGDDKYNDYILTLEIPKEAKRTANLKCNKCRCEYAKVIKIEKLNKNDNILEEIKDKNFEVGSLHDNDFKYKLNQVIKPDKYDDDIREPCVHGIHFFITKQDAIDYTM